MIAQIRVRPPSLGFVRPTANSDRGCESAVVQVRLGELGRRFISRPAWAGRYLAPSATIHPSQFQFRRILNPRLDLTSTQCRTELMKLSCWSKLSRAAGAKPDQDFRSKPSHVPLPASAEMSSTTPTEPSHMILLNQAFSIPWDPGSWFGLKDDIVGTMTDYADTCFDLFIKKLFHEIDFKCDFLHELLNEDVVSKGPIGRWCYLNSDSPTPMRKSPPLPSKVVYGDFVFQVNNLSLEDSVEEFFIRSEFCPVFALCGSLFRLQIEALSLWLEPWIGCACSGWIWYRDGFDLMYAETCSQPI